MTLPRRTTWTCGAASLAFAAGAPAAPIEARFTAGSLRVQGSSSTMNGDMFDSANVAFPVTLYAADGSGSTSSGLVTASATMRARIVRTEALTTVGLNGVALASQPAGYGGQANLGLVTQTLNGDDAPMVLSLSEEAVYTISNASSGYFVIVELTPVTGGFNGNRMLAGTYELLVHIRADLGDEQTSVRSDLSWALHLVRPPARCPTDFDRNGTHGVADIFAFLTAWFSSSPAADFNGFDGVNVADIFAFLFEWFAGCP